VRGVECDHWRDLRRAAAGSAYTALPSSSASSAQERPLHELGLEVGDEIINLWFAIGTDAGLTDRPPDAVSADASFPPPRQLVRVHSEVVSALPAESGGQLTITPLMTWDVLEMKPGPPPSALFTVASAAGAPVFGLHSDPDGTHSRAAAAAQRRVPPREIGEGLNVSRCERIPQDNGFPYFHVLHAYMYV
jgi:hypothetical protein